MTDEIFCKSALFFFLLTLDDKVATEATFKTIDMIRARLSARGPLAHQNSEIALETLVRCCIEHWSLVRFRFQKDKIQVINSKALIWPNHIDLNPWKEFQKRASENDLMAVTLVHVLGIPETLLARCLNVSEGTVRYRVGNGLALLGQLNRPSSGAIQFS